MQNGLNSIPLAEGENAKPDRFFLYPTENTFNFILLDQIDDRVWKEKLEEIHHTGTGRFSWLKMRPMSLFESGESEGTVSLAELFGGNTDFALKAPDHKLGAIAFMMCRGGWPGSLRKKSAAAAQLVATEYYQAVTHTDISKVDGVVKNPERVKRLMRSYARHQGSQVSLATIAGDISTNEVERLSEDTDKMKSPSFLMVLTAVGQFAYTRKDGVLVVPVGCLQP